MNGIKVGDEHDGSFAVNEDKVALADESIALKYFAKPLEKLCLSGTKEIFQIFHAGTASARLGLAVMANVAVNRIVVEEAFALRAERVVVIAARVANINIIAV